MGVTLGALAAEPRRRRTGSRNAGGRGASGFMRVATACAGGCTLGGHFKFFKGRTSAFLGVWAAQGAPETLPVQPRWAGGCNLAVLATICHIVLGPPFPWGDPGGGSGLPSSYKIRGLGSVPARVRGGYFVSNFILALSAARKMGVKRVGYKGPKGVHILDFRCSVS